MLTIEDRYRCDPVFHATVDLLYNLLEQQHREGNTITPTELREAALLAAVRFEARHVRPVLLHSRPECEEEA